MRQTEMEKESEGGRVWDWIADCAKGQARPDCNIIKSVPARTHCPRRRLDTQPRSTLRCALLCSFHWECHALLFMGQGGCRMPSSKPAQWPLGGSSSPNLETFLVFASPAPGPGDPPKLLVSIMSELNSQRTLSEFKKSRTFVVPPAGAINWVTKHKVHKISLRIRPGLWPGRNWCRS